MLVCPPFAGVDCLIAFYARPLVLGFVDRRTGGW
jgi:hypothetical protein